MVHPTQQRPSFAKRGPAPRITVTRGGKARSFTIRPWLAALAVTGFGLFLTAYVGATSYLIYRDDLLGASLSRQVAMQRSYEDRIAALRSELDRVTSRHVVQTLGVEEQLAVLLQRQSLIERQQSALDGLVEKARDTGVALPAAMARLPRPRPDAEPAYASQPADAPALAYAPPVAAIDEIITGTLIRGAEAGSHVDLRQDLKPVLSNVQSSLDDAERQQSDALDELSAATDSKADALSAALAPLGIEAEEALIEEPRGGPFIPAPRLHFVERTTMLNRSLDELSALRLAAAAMPLRAPLQARRISSRFGYRMDPFLRRPALHAGLDLVATTGTEVRATAAGTVVAAGWSGGYGQMVEIRHAGGVSTRYAHLSAILVDSGMRVSAGMPIGRVGSTGRSTGPHLHYETRRDGEPVNPTPFLQAGKAL